MAEVGNDILVTVPEAQLHEVNNGKERLVEWGELQLNIYTFEGVSGLWMKIGASEWSFDSSTPVLKAADRNFMFAMGGGRFYSVLLSQGTPADSVAMLEEVLVECSSFEYAGAMSKQVTDEAVGEVAQDVVDDDELPLAIAAPPKEPGHKRTPSDRILSGASAAQAKLMASANWASQKLLEQSRNMQAKTQPSENANISPQFAARVKLARRAAEKGNRAANRVAGGIADISVKLADSIVKRLGPDNKYGAQLQNPETRPGAAREVAAAAVVAAVGIYDSMEQAARLVLNSGGQATAEFIGHKYGQDAGEVARDAASASVTTGMTAMTMQKIGVKKIAKRIAKRTATGLAKSYIIPQSSQQGQGNAQQGTPALQGPPGSAQTSAQPYGQPQGQIGGYIPNQGAPSQQVGGNQSHGIPQAAPMQASQPQPIVGSTPAPTEYRSPFANGN